LEIFPRDFLPSLRDSFCSLKPRLKPWAIFIRRFRDFSHRLLLRETVQRAETPDQTHDVNADDGTVAEQFTQDTSI
jgi:hypothetical protein